jgi:hypothetical protein
VKEFINFELLGVENLKSAGNKECVSVTFDQSGNTTDLTLKSEDCAGTKRVICEVTILVIFNCVIVLYHFVLETI